MAFTRTTTINSAPGGDSVKQAVLDLDTDLTGAFGHLNTHDHSGGDGAQIAYSGLSGLPALGSMAAQNTSTYAGPGSSQAFTVGALSATTGTFSNRLGIGCTPSTRLLEIGGAINPGMNLRSTSTTGTCALYMGDSDADNRGFVGYDNSDDSMVLGAAGATKMTLNASGNILVGTATDDGVNKLQVNGGISATSTVFSSGTVGFWCKNSSGGKILLEDADTADASKPFGYITHNGSSTIHGVANRSGGVITGSVDILGVSSTGLSVTGGISASTGVLFGNTTNAATNVLDWYEEGTFTPSASGNTTAGTGTYSIQQGYYTRIGREVNFRILLSWSAHTGTGGLNITGLPFTSSNATNHYPNASFYYNGLLVGAGKMLTSQIAPSSTSMSLFASDPSGGATAVINNGTFDTAVASLSITGTYMV